MVSLSFYVNKSLPIIRSLAQQFAVGDWIWMLIFLLVLVLVWWLLSRSTKQSYAEARELEAQIAEEHEALLVPEDLTKIEGIGPKINALLQDSGITTFEKLGEMDADKIKELLISSGITIADPTTWPEQARLAAEDQWEALDEFQGQLTGGRTFS